MLDHWGVHKTLKCSKFDFRWGAFSAPPELLTVFKGREREGTYESEGVGEEKRGEG